MSFDNIKLEKGLYRTGKSFSSALEMLDPSENYKGTSLEGLDAYQRQLKRFNIRVSGTGSDTVSKFFQTTDSSALFPEYVARAVRQGMEEADVLPKIVATTTVIDSLDYRAVESVTKDDDKELQFVAEGAKIPETTIRTKETLTPLKKRGRMLVASYEAIKFQKLDLFTVTLRQIGTYIARCQVRDALDAICNDNIDTIEAASSAMTYSDLIKFWNEFAPYNMTTLIANPNEVAAMLNMSEMKDSNAGLNFHSTGNMITPLGAELLKSSYAPAGKIVGIDNTCAVEKVQAGDIETDFDKLIDRQLERAAITSTAGFSKIFDGASKILTIKQ